MADDRVPFTDEQLAYLEERLGGGVVAPLAIAPTGRVPDVVDGELIESAWGNAIRDRGVPRYDSIAALKTDTLSMVALVNMPTSNAGYVLAWRKTVGGGWITSYAGSFSRTADATYGYNSVTYAELNLASIIAFTCSVAWSTTANTPQWVDARPNDPLSLVEIRGWMIGAGNTVVPATSKGMAIQYHVTGAL